MYTLRVGPLSKWLGRVGHKLRSEYGNKMAQVHATRLRRISDSVMETGESKDGMLCDSHRLVGKISNVEMRRNTNTEQK